MATFIGLVKKTNYEQYYNEVRNNPGDFVKRVLQSGQAAGQPLAGSEPNGRFVIGDNVFTLTLATNGKTRQLCIRREFENGESWMQMRMMELMDFLFFRSSTRSMEWALRSGTTMTTGLATCMRGHADRIVEELWPSIEVPNVDDRPSGSERRRSAVPTNQRPISERSLSTLASLIPGEIDAWMRCPEGGPVGLKHIDRSRTRIEGDILVLSFKSGGDAIEFRLQGRGSGRQEQKERVGRDMERLLRIARGERDGCGYRNMAELMGRFMVATIEDEAPRLLEKSSGAIDSGNGDDPLQSLLIYKVKEGGTLEPTRATRRAIARAVDEAMASCRASAAQRFQTVLNAVCRDKAECSLFSAAMDARATLVANIKQTAKPFLAGQRLAAFVRQVVQEHGVSAEAANELHANRGPNDPLPGRVRLVNFRRKPGLLERLSRDQPRHEVLALASRQDSTTLRFVPRGERSMAQWAWKTIRLAEVPKDVESDARALHQTVFDNALGQFFQSEIVPLIDVGVNALENEFRFGGDGHERGAAKDLLLKLMANLRIGNTTFGYLHRWYTEGQAASSAKTGNASAPASVIVPQEASVLDGQVAENPVSQRQAAAYALRQHLKEVVDPVTRLTESDCNKPVTVYTGGKFVPLRFAFGATASSQQGNGSPQWHGIGKGKSPDQQPAPSPSGSSASAEVPPSAPPSASPSAPPNPEIVPVEEGVPV